MTDLATHGPITAVVALSVIDEREHPDDERMRRLPVLLEFSAAEVWAKGSRFFLEIPANPKVWMNSGFRYEYFRGETDRVDILADRIDALIAHLERVDAIRCLADLTVELDLSLKLLSSTRPQLRLDREALRRLRKFVTAVDVDLYNWAIDLAAEKLGGENLAILEAGAFEGLDAFQGSLEVAFSGEHEGLDAIRKAVGSESRLSALMFRGTSNDREMFQSALLRSLECLENLQAKGLLRGLTHEVILEVGMLTLETPNLHLTRETLDRLCDLESSITMTFSNPALDLEIERVRSWLASR